MLSIEKRREIFTKYFVDFHYIRQVSRELSISRDAVSKIIKEYRSKIIELNLVDEPDLSKYIDSIVTEPHQKPRIVARYKVTEEQFKFIKKIVDENEKNRILYGKKKKVKDLFWDCCGINISISTFYGLVREIKNGRNN